MRDPLWICLRDSLSSCNIWYETGKHLVCHVIWARIETVSSKADTVSLSKKDVGTHGRYLQWSNTNIPFSPLKHWNCQPSGIYQTNFWSKFISLFMYLNIWFRRKRRRTCVMSGIIPFRDSTPAEWSFIVLNLIYMIAYQILVKSHHSLVWWQMPCYEVTNINHQPLKWNSRVFFNPAWLETENGEGLAQPGLRTLSRKPWGNFHTVSELEFLLTHFHCIFHVLS